MRVQQNFGTVRPMPTRRLFFSAGGADKAQHPRPRRRRRPSPSPEPLVKAEDPRYSMVVTALLGVTRNWPPNPFSSRRTCGPWTSPPVAAPVRLAWRRLLLAQKRRNWPRPRRCGIKAGGPRLPAARRRSPLMAGLCPNYRPAFLVKDLKAACDGVDKRLQEKEESPTDHSAPVQALENPSGNPGKKERPSSY
jgi:hypothetical protein